MRRKIVTLGNPILRERAQVVHRFDKELQKLIDDMIDTMRSANGIGLAAPQIGVPKRVIVVCKDEKEITALVNPSIEKAEGLEEGEEGCLSIPGLYGVVPRPVYVSVKGYTPKGKEVRIEAEGLLARAFCHEVDHLDGILFIDKAYPETLHWVEPKGDEEEGECG